MIDSRKLVILILFEISSSVANVQESALVTLPEGQIRGRTLRTPNGKDYYAFQEIPYAAPPTGELRFKPPRAHNKWNGVLNTTKNTKICHKTDKIVYPGTTETEDCLYLNVYTPSKPGLPSKTPLAVLIWIHGGGFQHGTSVFQLFKPQYLIDHNIVLVTINYRLGVLGFLTTEDGVIPGNLGLKDQHFAIRWVQKNIHLFGGDPERISISGGSVGAASVALQLISPRNKGLFRGAIIQSGTALGQWSRQDHARFYAFELGRTLDPNFKSDDSKELLRLLQITPASKLVNNSITPNRGKETGLIEREGLIWVPVIEAAHLEDAFVTGLFHEDVKNGNINQVPIMIGINSEEQLLFWKSGTIPQLRSLAKYFDNDPSNLIKNRFNMTEENKLIAGRRIRQIYTNGTFEDDLPALFKFLSDEMFTIPTIRHAKLQSNYTDVYLYQFSYKGKMGRLKDAEVAGVRGVGHGEELGYLMDSPPSSDRSPDDPKDLVTRQRLLTLWSNFVKYLNPIPERNSLLNNVTWEKVTPNNLVYLNINDTLEIQKNPRNYLKYEEIVDAYAIPPLINY